MCGSSDSPLEAVTLGDSPQEAVDPTAIRTALNADAASVRQRGARVCKIVSEDDVDTVRPFVSELGRLLSDENPGVVQTATSALTEIATADTTAVVDVLDDVVALGDAELGSVQLSAAQLLRTVANQDPTHCSSVVDVLLDRLLRPPEVGSDDQSVATHIEDRVTSRVVQQHEREEQQHEQVARHIFANIAVAVAETEPSALTDHIETVADLTAVEDVVVRGAALDILGPLCRDDPSKVEPFGDVIAACLDTDVSVLEARAIRTLGFLGDAQYADVLREVAATESDEEIAAFAEETAAHLES